jgi:hypothetical protein
MNAQPPAVVQIILGLVILGFASIGWMKRHGNARDFDRRADSPGQSRIFQSLSGATRMRRFARFNVAVLGPVLLIALGLTALIVGIVRAF